MTKQEMIDVINEKVANNRISELVFKQTDDLLYCKKDWDVWIYGTIFPNLLKEINEDQDFLDNVRGICDSVVFGDVWDYCIKNTKFTINNWNGLASKWKNKRGSIEEQDERCIKYVYDLIKEND